MTIESGDLVLISIDDHIIEPPDVFERHVPAKFKDQAPRLLTDDNGDVFWSYAGHVVPNIALGAVAGRPNDEWGFEPSRYEDMRPGCFNVHERVRDMDIAGVIASLNFPTFPTISGALFTFKGEPEVSGAMVRAYNTWHLEDWCGAYPDRFIPMGILPLWDAELAAKEIHWLASRGCRAVTVPQHIGTYDGPPWQDRFWDPLWAACQDEQTVINVHIGTGGGAPVPSDLTHYIAYNAMIAVDTVRITADLVFSRVLQEFPDLTIALSEGGIGWIPFMLERLDETYLRQRAWTGDDLGDGVMPSDVFRKNFLACFIRDRIGIQTRHSIGIDTICWEMDYPHSDSSWPDAPEQLIAELDGCTFEEIEKITWQNAAQRFHYTGIERLGRHNCTVNTLRNNTTTRDTTAPKVDAGRAPKAGAHPITYGDMKRIKAAVFSGGVSTDG
jgi:predicted TIM-barrel fold metal-dependent hydrolase